MQVSCPVCDETEKLNKVKGPKEILVRNDAITVDMDYFKCANCGEEFLVPSSQSDPLEKAYRLYRQKHRLLQPEEIRDFRRKFDMTQRELSNLLGLGVRHNKPLRERQNTG